MSKIKRMLTGIVFQDDGTAEPAPPQEKAPSAFKGTASVPTAPNVQSFSSTQTVRGVVDNKFVETLTKIIEG